ncbi:hypothetical protein K0M31_012465 [Melipona bicolor]|uniref:Uncharacterized protein n=1 Tax=Melipona bicolor TaxID=60889 RepID=A0AA40KHH7_9HYME|nr:hypothetical protein K0M31_012465 [Melipona bicolor]
MEIRAVGLGLLICPTKTFLIHNIDRIEPPAAVDFNFHTSVRRVLTHPPEWICPGAEMDRQIPAFDSLHPFRDVFGLFPERPFRFRRTNTVQREKATSPGSSSPKRSISTVMYHYRQDHRVTREKRKEGINGPERQNRKKAWPAFGKIILGKRNFSEVFAFSADTVAGIGGPFHPLEPAEEGRARRDPDCKSEEGGGTAQLPELNVTAFRLTIRAATMHDFRHCLRPSLHAASTNADAFL